MTTIEINHINKTMKLNKQKKTLCSTTTKVLESSIKKVISINWLEKKLYHGFIYKDFNINGKIVTIRITKGDFFVNITDIAFFFDARKPISHYLQKKEVCDCSNKLSKNYLPVVHTFVGRKGSTWVHHNLALQIVTYFLNFKKFYYEFKDFIIEQIHSFPTFFMKKTLGSLNRRPKVVLRKGSYGYAYPVNGVAKSGDSLQNKDGKHSRTNGQAVSVARLHYEFIIYMNRAAIISIRGLLKKTFEREQCNRDHYLCSPEQINNFIITYCLKKKY
jgi:hypothetical protein